MATIYVYRENGLRLTRRSNLFVIETSPSPERARDWLAANLPFDAAHPQNCWDDIDWCHDNCTGSYSFFGYAAHFALAEDAALYKLFWHGDA